MGLLFKRYEIHGYCSQCNNWVAREARFLVVEPRREGLCFKCNNELERQDQVPKDFYRLRGTSIEIKEKSVMAWLLIFAPSMIFGAIGLSFFLLFLVSAFFHLIKGIGEAFLVVYGAEGVIARLLHNEWLPYLIPFISGYYVYRLLELFIGRERNKR